MGIEYRGVLCVGYDWDELEELMDYFPINESLDYYEWIEENDLSSFSPYYDADKEDCIYGIEVVGSDDYSYFEVGEKLDQKIEHFVQKYIEKFSKRPKVYIMAYGM